MHSVDEFVFSVPDLAQARHVYTSFGLDVRAEGDALALYTHGHAHRWARVLQGSSKRLLWLTPGIHGADVQRFAQRLDERGIARIAVTPFPQAQTGGLWIQGPDTRGRWLLQSRRGTPSFA